MVHLHRSSQFQDIECFILDFSLNNEYNVKSSLNSAAGKASCRQNETVAYKWIVGIQNNAALINGQMWPAAWDCLCC